MLKVGRSLARSPWPRWGVEERSSERASARSCGAVQAWAKSLHVIPGVRGSQWRVLRGRAPSDLQFLKFSACKFELWVCTNSQNKGPVELPVWLRPTAWHRITSLLRGSPCSVNSKGPYWTGSSVFPRTSRRGSSLLANSAHLHVLWSDLPFASSLPRDSGTSPSLYRTFSQEY